MLDQVRRGVRHRQHEGDRDTRPLQPQQQPVVQDLAQLPRPLREVLGRDLGALLLPLGGGVEDAVQGRQQSAHGPAPAAVDGEPLPQQPPLVEGEGLLRGEPAELGQPLADPGPSGPAPGEAVAFVGGAVVRRAPAAAAEAAPVEARGEHPGGLVRQQFDRAEHQVAAADRTGLLGEVEQFLARLVQRTLPVGPAVRELGEAEQLDAAADPGLQRAVAVQAGPADGPAVLVAGEVEVHRPVAPVRPAPGVPGPDPPLGYRDVEPGRVQPERELTELPQVGGIGHLGDPDGHGRAPLWEPASSY